MATGTDVQAILKEADEAVARADQDAAIALCQQAIVADPRSVAAYTKLAELYVQKGQIKDAAQQYLTIAKAYYDSKLMKGAMKHYQRVVELDEKCLEARERLVGIYESESMERESKLEALKVAELYLEVNDLNQAETAAQKAIALKSIEARYVLGLVHFRREMWKEAAVDLAMLTKMKPNHFEAFFHLGTAQMKMNQFGEAIQAYEKAKSLKADDLPMLEGLSAAYIGKNMVPEAMEAAAKYAEVAKKAGDDERVKKAVQQLLGLATQVLKVHDTERAKAIYQRLLIIDSGCQDAKDGLAKVDTKAEAQPEPQKSPAAQIPAAQTPKPIVAAAPTPVTPAMSVPVPTTSPAMAGATGTIEERIAKADELLRSTMYQEAIDILRELTKVDPANMTIRQRLHQAYLLAAQQEQSVAVPPPPQKGVPPPFKDTQKPTIERKKGVKISYL